MNKIALLALVIIAVGIGGYFAYTPKDQEAELVPTPQPQEQTPTTSAPQGKLMSVEAYVTQNISALSPIKETMGGTFYVTEIEVEPEENKGKVKYEDGHNAYEAEFTYTSNDRTGHTITSFVVRE
ncbi:hypothetical protein JNK62_00320 [bacterium]|nr:hypothetical protein [bacterium]